MEYDRTRLPDVYVAARSLPTAALDAWRAAIERAVPPGPDVARVVDLGCGTGRFSAMLAEVFGATVLGVDPSLRMLGNRDGPDHPKTRLVAGTAEALPLATASIDLAFLSMVYHHLRVPDALGELRRILRPGGRAVVRNPTRETIESYEFLRFFPEAQAIDLARMPSRRSLAGAFRAHGFAPASHRVVVQTVATDHRDYLRKISLRGLSALQAIADDAFARGLHAFARHCQSIEDERPITEPVDLFVFVG